MSDPWDHPLDELAALVADIWATPDTPQHKSADWKALEQQPPPPCRCGWQDWRLGVTSSTPPRTNLSGHDIDLQVNTWHRAIACANCTHPIRRDTRCVVVRTDDEYLSRRPHYHPECVEF